MRRGDFEGLVRRHLDGVLVPRGFSLTPQLPADWDDDQPSAVYEARPNEFARRYPAFAPLLASYGELTVPCIDLWVHLDPSSGRITCELEGPSLEARMDELGIRDPSPAEEAPETTAEQLDRLAVQIAAVLDAATGVPPGGIEPPFRP